MSNIPQWYDYRTGNYRDDIWPFQSVSKMERKLIGKDRLLANVNAGLRKLPNGWSVQWKASRRRQFRLNHSTKTISVPFPANGSGLPCFSSAIWLAEQISLSYNYSAGQKSPPAYHVKSWEHPWMVRHGASPKASVIPSQSAFLSYHYGGGGCSFNHRAWRQASLNTTKEVLRWMSSPRAWQVPRLRKGMPHPQVYWHPMADSRMLEAIAYRKALMDYIKVNDTQYPLPSKAAAKLKKITPTQQP